jgi:FSR family fosmidomycin resistance protein-like MFS transporter
VTRGVDKKAMAALSSGHLATDLAQGALPALLPFLKDEFGLSYALAAALVLGSTFASSIIQPVFGLWSDARGALWLLPAGVAFSGIFMGLAAIASSYALVFLCVLVSGVGVAAYHPEGSKFASYVSGTRRASGMSLFSIGGNIGFALGPVLAAAAVGVLGLKGGLLVMVPGLAVAAMLLGALPYLAGFAPDVAAVRAMRPEPGQPKALALLLGVVGLRAVAHMGLFTFVPLWEVANGRSKVHGTVLLSLFLFSGAVGTILGGPAADRFGRRPVVVSSLAAATPLILVYVLAGGLLGGAALILAGAFVIGTFGVTLVMSQEYMPGRVGMASGLSIGLAIGLGGVAAVTLGAVADAIDLRTAVLLTATGPALGVILTLLLPPARRPRLVEPEPVPSIL